jgi:uncharacterized protein
MARDGDLPVGRVIGTDDATPTEFWVGVGDDGYLQLDDVVALERALPGEDEPVRIYGVVAQVRARQDGAKFDSDVFLAQDGMLPMEVSEAAQILVTRVEPEVFVPPRPGEPVRIARGDDRDKALFFDKMEGVKLPAGSTRDGQPVYINFEFLNGTRGAHVNISGVSGVATKTSYATFLLHSIFTSGALGASAANAKGLIFNLKGEDLLHIDRANTKLEPDQADRYATLGLPAASFQSVNIWSPRNPRSEKLKADAGSRQTGVKPYMWTIAEFCAEGMLPYLFADAQDERHQYSTCVAVVTERLRKDAQAQPSGAVKIHGNVLDTFTKLVDYISDLVEDENDDSWRGRSIGMPTAQAFVRRLSSAAPHVKHLLTGEHGQGAGNNPYRIDLQSAQVTVVHLAKLGDRAQRFVIGVLLRTMFEQKEAEGAREPLTFVVLDELNKYAPAQGHSPIKETLLDIAERGRSMGIILIGAQQTASEVERRITSNSSIQVVGRLGAAEASRQEYAWLPPSQRQRATIIKPGTMMLSQPQIPVPMAIEFPFPAWATRADEAGHLTTPDGDDMTEDELFDVNGGPRDTTPAAVPDADEDDSTPF